MQGAANNILGMSSCKLLHHRVRLFFAAFVLLFFALSPWAALSALAQASAGQGFSDVRPTDYYYNSVAYLADQGLVHRSEKYRPDDFVSRAEMAKIAALFAKLPLASASRPFQDVSEKDWFASYANALHAHDLAKGYPQAGRLYFKPDQYLTRAEMAVLMDRILRTTETSPVRFSDVPSAHWAHDSVGRLAAAGVMKGKGGGSFGLSDRLNRADISVILQRASRLGLKSLSALDSGAANETDGGAAEGSVGEEGGNAAGGANSGGNESGGEANEGGEAGGSGNETGAAQSGEGLEDCDGHALDLSKAHKDRVVCFDGPDGLELRGIFYKSEGDSLPAIIVIPGSGGIYSSNGGEILKTGTDGNVALHADGIGSDLDDLPVLFSQSKGMGLIVDSFAPRGYDPDKDSKSQRPEGVELAKDAQFAKTLLSSLEDGKGARIANGKFALVGYSHGGGAVTIASMANEVSPIQSYLTGPEFKYYANYYGGCGKIFDMAGDAPYRNRAPIHFFHGTQDPISEHCTELLRQSKLSDSVNLAMDYYQGAGHGFFYEDGAADVAAKQESLTAIKADFNKWLGTSFQ